MAQLVERSVLIPEVHSSNPVIGKNLYWTFTVNCIEKTKIKKKRPGMAHKKTIIVSTHRPLLLLNTVIFGKTKTQHLIKGSLYQMTLFWGQNFLFGPQLQHENIFLRIFWTIGNKKEKERERLCPPVIPFNVQIFFLFSSLTHAIIWCFSLAPIFILFTSILRCGVIRW